MRVLCLDHEGGYGGSSRSLYLSLRFMEKALVEPEVWCRLRGPIQPRYEMIGIPCRVTPQLPKFSSLPRLSRNAYFFTRSLIQFLNARSFREKLVNTINERFDLVHLNHEGLFMLAGWLRPRIDKPVTMHIRTRLIDSPFARWQVSSLSRSVDHFIFITENERDHFKKLGGTGKGTVIYNIAHAPESGIEPMKTIPSDGRFKVAYISNYSWAAGNDRLIEVARELVKLRRRDILFVVAGRTGLNKSLPGLLGEIARQGGTLEDYARACGFEDMFLFLGHVGEPERIIASCHILSKFGRGNCPWSRDILECQAFGKPALSVGTYDRFIKHDETGVLHAEFNPRSMAVEIIRFADKPERVREYGKRAKERIRKLCDGPERAAELLDIWQGLAETGRRPTKGIRKNRRLS